MFTNHKWAHVDGDPHTSLCKCLVKEGGDQKEVICMSQFANELFGFWLMEGGIFCSIYELPEKSMAEHSTCPALPCPLPCSQALKRKPPVNRWEIPQSRVWLWSWWQKETWTHTASQEPEAVVNSLTAVGLARQPCAEYELAYLLWFSEPRQWTSVWQAGCCSALRDKHYNHFSAAGGGALQPASYHNKSQPWNRLEKCEVRKTSEDTYHILLIFFHFTYQPQ